jgi:hypothetical protein
MTLSAANKNLALHTNTPTTQQAQHESAGWDPFEIWRTRVLLPRLAEAHEDKAAGPHADPINLLLP